ncbi:MAG: LPXTG cell wall anchor domain-containing protein, partial [Peptococcaceae bacterium]|jgi:LPXTG-motif cell wall-anchored protein|nr:LPXTG cell wall anchor domain-containing protein [Peptococcaceae bacterium]
LQDILPDGFVPKGWAAAGDPSVYLRQSVAITVVTSSRDGDVAGTPVDVTDQGLLALKDNPFPPGRTDSVISFTFAAAGNSLYTYLAGLRGGAGTVTRMYMDVALILTTDDPAQAPRTAVNTGWVLVNGDYDDDGSTEVSTPDQKMMFDVTFIASPGEFSDGFPEKVLRAPYGGVTKHPDAEPGEPYLYRHAFVGWYLAPDNDPAFTGYEVGEKPPESRRWIPGSSIVEGPVTVYALWEEAYQITLEYRNRAGDELALSRSVTIVWVAKGSDFIAASPPLVSGYMYLGWLLDEQMFWLIDPPPALMTAPIRILNVNSDHVVSIVYGQDRGGGPDGPGEPDGKEDVTIYRSWMTVNGMAIKPREIQYINVEDSPYRSPGGAIIGYEYKGYKVSRTPITSGFDTYLPGIPYETLIPGVNLYVAYIYSRVGGDPYDPGDGGDGSDGRDPDDGGDKDEDLEDDTAEGGRGQDDSVDGYIDAGNGSNAGGDSSGTTRPGGSDLEGGLPKTGDLGLPFGIILGAVCSAAVAVVAIWIRRRRRSR